MAFSGGGSNVLKPHTHDSTILQDGGNLNFQNITQSNMSAGSVTYSDGNHLQELILGAAGTQLQVVGAAPAWVSDPAQGKYQLLDSYNAGATPALTKTFTFSPVLNLQTEYSEIIVVGNLNCAATTLGLGEMQLNGIGGTAYQPSYGFDFNGAAINNYLRGAGTSQPSFVLFPSTTNVAGSGVRFKSRISLIETGGGAVDNYGITTDAEGDGGVPARTSSHVDSAIFSAGSTLSSITVFTGGNWNNDSNISVYGVLLS